MGSGLSYSGITHWWAAVSRWFGHRPTLSYCEMFRYVLVAYSFKNLGLLASNSHTFVTLDILDLNHLKQKKIISAVLWTIKQKIHAICVSGSRRFSVFTALHVMQTRYSEENSVCPSVCLSVCHTRGLWLNGGKICPDLYTVRKNI